MSKRNSFISLSKKNLQKTQPLSRDRFGLRARPEGAPLHRELSFTVVALDRGLLPEPLDTQDIPKVYAVLRLTARARAKGDLLVLEDEVVRDVGGDVIDQRTAEQDEEDGIDQPEEGDELPRAEDPQKRRHQTHRQVEKVRSEGVILERHGTYAGVDVALWLR